MTGWMQHLVIAPILVPLVAAALMLFFERRQRFARLSINLLACLANLAIAIALLRIADGWQGGMPVIYRLGDWPAPVAIVLVLDRLSAMMLLIAAIVALSSLVFSLARWHRAGTHFHPMFQLCVMGLNGAFLTGDLFNLFVFFEVMLAASYGLVMHGSGVVRVKAGLHYIAVNLVSSLLFLIGVAVIYGVAGTLNMADLAARLPHLAAETRPLFHAGAAILGIAFLIKAGIWPLNFWLPTAYTAASPPVSALFAVMSKVGIYVLLRLWLMYFSEAAPGSAFGGHWLMVGGMATLFFAMMKVLASQDTARLAAYSVLVSSGTLLAGIGINDVWVTGGALYYMASSTLTLAAFFLLIELAERGRDVGADIFAVTFEAFGDPDDEDPEDDDPGIPIPATLATLALSFLACMLMLAGLPPLAGFIAKFAMLDGVMTQVAQGTGLYRGLLWSFFVLV
ncbi:MAG TPA: monovalent cation/H+ antiporter subunit D, partial [Sphingomonadales bacterium]